MCIAFSKILFTTYRSEQVMSSDGNLYLLQYGSYINREVMEKNIIKLKSYVIHEEDNKYYVYLGAFTKKEIALEMQKVYEHQGIYTYLKNDYIGDSDKIKTIKKLEMGIMEMNDIDKEKRNQEILKLLEK